MIRSRAIASRAATSAIHGGIVDDAFFDEDDSVFDEDGFFDDGFFDEDGVFDKDGDFDDDDFLDDGLFDDEDFLDEGFLDDGFLDDGFLDDGFFEVLVRFAGFFGRAISTQRLFFDDGLRDRGGLLAAQAEQALAGPGDRLRRRLVALHLRHRPTLELFDRDRHAVDARQRPARACTPVQLGRHLLPAREIEAQRRVELRWLLDVRIGIERPRRIIEARWAVAPSGLAGFE